MYVQRIEASNYTDDPITVLDFLVFNSLQCKSFSSGHSNEIHFPLVAEGLRQWVNLGVKVTIE